MAISGAYGAGFISGFSEDLVGRVDARTEKQDKYMDLMIENARAKAPKYAAYKAEQRQLDSMGVQLQTDFKLTKAEVEFLKGKGALTDFHKTVYEQRNAAAANNQTYNFDKNLFFAAMNLEDRTLPMSTSDKLAVAGKVYNDNVSGSKNPKSEATKVNSAKNALSKLLAFNPRLSAEEAVRAMEVAGYSADELMDWDPNAPRQDLYSEIAMPTTAIPVVEFTASENKNVTNESATRLRRLIGIEDANGNPLDFATGDILGADTPKNEKTLELARLTEEGANTFAQINKRLAYQGLGNPQQLNVLANRYSALSYFRSKIDTQEELKFLIDAEKKGLVTEFLLNNPMPTDEQLDKFFSQSAETATANVSESKPPEDVTPEEDTPEAVTPEAAQTEADVDAAANVVVDSSLSNAALVETVLKNSKDTTSDMAALGLTDDDMGLPDGPVNFGLTDDDMGLPDSPVVDTLAPAISSGAAASEWLNSVNPLPPTEDLNTGLVTTNYKVASATTAGLATAIDFLTGFVGGAQETKISRDLKKLSRTQAERAAEVAALGFTEYFSSDLPPKEVVDEVKDNYVKLFTSTSDTPAYKELQQLIQDRIEYADRKRSETPSVVQDNTELEAAAPKSEEDIVLEAAIVEIDEQTKRIKDMDRQFLADEKNYPQPLKAMTSIEPLSINTPAELDAAIAERVGEMPPDYKKQVVSAVASINKTLKDFEAEANLTVDTVIDTVSPSNLAEAISNLTARMFDTTLEERIMNNEGQRNRAIAFAKLQQQLSELTLFPERVPVDMNDIDPYPTMGRMGAERLHSLQDDINTSILSATKKLLSKIGFGNNSSEAVEGVNPESLVTRPKKPKEMTSSDKTRLRRAQKVNELSGDSGLLEMLIKKYGIEIVQKEMGL